MDLDSATNTILSEYGYMPYKPNKHIQIRDDMLFLISFEGRKNDIYIWHAVYPLAQANISFGRGRGKYAGRVPEIEGTLSINESSSTESVSTELAAIIKSNVIPMQSTIQSLRDIADSFSPGSPAAFAYFSLGDYDKGMELLNNYKAFREGMSEHTTVEPEIAEFINSVSPSNINELLEINRTSNIKKLRLSKYV